MEYYDYDVNPFEYVDRLIDQVEFDKEIKRSSTFYIVYNVEDFYVYDIVMSEEAADRIAVMLCERIDGMYFDYAKFDARSHIKTQIELQRDPKKALSNLMKQINLLKRGKIK